MIIILYVMDSLRPDFLSCYGYHKETSPHIDALAREGVLFKNAFAQATWTRPSGASLLSSTYPSVHGIWTLHDPFSAFIHRLPEAVKDLGFHTIALSTMGNISPSFGFGKGFDRFIELYKEEEVTVRRVKARIENPQWEIHFPRDGHVPITTSEDINEFLLPLLRQYEGVDAFFFIWSLDTHAPYFCREEKLARFSSPGKMWMPGEIVKVRTQKELHSLRATYEDMIYYNDHYLGRLIETMKEWGLFDRTFFILTSDHGEAFGEHGFNGHGMAPYDELIRVPLIMKVPHSKFRGQISDLVQHIDIAPTLLDYLNVERTGIPFQGQSLLPVLEGRSKGNEFVFAEYQLDPKLPKYLTIRTEEYKYFEIRPGKVALQPSFFRTLSPFYRAVFPQRLLFRVKDDPHESVNVIKNEREVARQLRLRMNDFLKENERRSRGARRETEKKRSVDKDVASQLKALGYFD